MDKYCYSGETQRPLRRINGLQLPLNYQQISAWIVFLITAVFNFIIVQIQFYELKVTSTIIYINLYIFHIFSHIIALVLDPAEEDIRKRETYDVAEFDRSIHAHVIENGRCHLCNIYTSNKNTKHCGICNKCVYYFDHHCKWLNNCIGQRNYVAFIICVVTAALTALLTASLCLFNVTLFFTNSQLFSSEAQYFINCTNLEQNARYCKNSILFLTLLIVLFVCAVAICCALLHLLCFHVYIKILGVSTYEYIMSTSNIEPHRLRCCNMNISKRLYTVSKKSVQTSHHNENTPKYVNARIKNTAMSTFLQTRSDNNVANLIHILLNEEMKRAKKSLLYERNKVHPLEENQN